MILKTTINSVVDLKNIVGVLDANIHVIDNLYNTNIIVRGEHIYADMPEGPLSITLDKLFEYLLKIAHSGIRITPRDIIYVNNLIKSSEDDKITALYENRKLICKSFTNKPIYPKTIKQVEYVKMLDKMDLILCVGPAGTGKTYLAVLDAVNKFRNKKFKKIILTRPAVEAGENLGYLPGDLKEKIDPYLRPLYDALYETLGVEQTDDLIEKQVIEIAPLAYMRGRTLSNAYVILDEAQNTTKGQMKMFLTRLGFNSKMVITGDISQVDLPKKEESGLKIAVNKLKGIKEIGIMEFENMDIVRNPLVQKIVERFEEK